MAKKLVAVAYSAKMAYYVSHCLLTYLPILGDDYVWRREKWAQNTKWTWSTWTIELKPTCVHVLIIFVSIIKDILVLIFLGKLDSLAVAKVF